MVATTHSSRGRLFGIPLGDFGLFSSLLLSFSLGFTAFFATCFLSIVGILIYNNAGHHSMNFADSYRYIALPAGLVVLVISLAIFMGLWLRRTFSGK